MPQQVILFSGASAVGKTSVLKSLLPLLVRGGMEPCICKIDCLKTGDAEVFQGLDLPCVTGLSEDICPDHFLVSNLPELWAWADRLGRDALVIETAGLCHRCSPATEHMVAGCVLDCTASCRAPGQPGPMLTQALFPVDGLAGYGTDLLAQWLLARPECGSFEGDTLRHTMPSGVCSYCVGEQRVGSAFQQGVVGKISFEEAPV